MENHYPATPKAGLLIRIIPGWVLKRSDSEVVKSTGFNIVLGSDTMQLNFVQHSLFFWYLASTSTLLESRIQSPNFRRVFILFIRVIAYNVDSSSTERQLSFNLPCNGLGYNLLGFRAATQPNLSLPRPREAPAKGCPPKTSNFGLKYPIFSRFWASNIQNRTGVRYKDNSIYLAVGLGKLYHNEFRSARMKSVRYYEISEKEDKRGSNKRSQKNKISGHEDRKTIQPQTRPVITFLQFGPKFWLPTKLPTLEYPICGQGFEILVLKYPIFGQGKSKIWPSNIQFSGQPLAGASRGLFDSKIHKIQQRRVRTAQPNVDSPLKQPKFLPGSQMWDKN
ncbi:hypothetical protein C8F04DRAFT_1240756 [Mycena alexandri]|uniref:Uncharacterized protein n=1 Tax=Mycena alexandri TaxID=1745969 RepID=A0AAD6WPR6_9AGAR|nr:hypothetical protein C8F04DRAFT_1240756 [Mycena alexandri]